jgi:hypothetical protein
MGSIRNRTCGLVRAAVLAAYILVACSGNISGALSPAVPSQEARYRGTATVHIQYCDIDMAGVITCSTRRTYRNSVWLYTGPVLKCESATETNPFHLSIASDQDTKNPHDGEFSILSSANPLVGFDGGCALLQFWTYDLEGASLAGTLTDTHSAENLAWNLTWTTRPIAPGADDMVLPSSMGKGTILRGTLTTQNAKLHIEGNTVDKLRPFSIDITARRKE